MSNVVEQLKAEWEEHKGEFVLTQSHRLERFVAIGDDGDVIFIPSTNRAIVSKFESVIIN